MPTTDKVINNLTTLNKLYKIVFNPSISNTKCRYYYSKVESLCENQLSSSVHQDAVQTESPIGVHLDREDSLNK